MAHDMSRRRVLFLGGLTAAVTAVCGTVHLRRAGVLEPAPRVQPLDLARRRFPVGAATEVRLVGYDRGVSEPRAYQDAMSAALDTPAARRLADRIRVDVRAGRPVRVLVKPAVNSGKAYPYTASPESVRAVCAWLSGLGVDEILVGDMSGPGRNTRAALRSTGIERAALEGGAHSVFCFDERPRRHRWVTHAPAAATSFPDGFRLTAVLSEVDYLIDVARVSTHASTGTTLSLKNWQGLAGWPTRMYTHGRAPSLADCMAEYALAVKPDLVVIDAGLAVTTHGPDDGLAVPLGVLLVAEDMVAADLVSVALLRHACLDVDRVPGRPGRPFWLEDPRVSVWQAPVVARAVELEVGAFAREQVVVDGYRVAPQLLSAVERTLDG